MADTADRLELYADYVCPFCYLGRQSLERYRETRTEPLEIDWQPYDLRRGKRKPDGSIDHDADGKSDEYFEQAKRNVRRLQDEYDIEMRREMATDVDSLPAQQASWYVKEAYPGRWADFDAAIYDALWQAGRDIGDVDVLIDLSADLDLPADELRDAVEDDSLRAALEDRFAAAQQRGVTGVPTFVVDGRAARGAVPPARLERLVDGA